MSKFLHDAERRQGFSNTSGFLQNNQAKNEF